ncbi:hypothetical protein V1477_015276 [Vespula maculifrons]|uniref:Uncharacterized protein n=1 Tax=Vespula maculifrons TaxID=7453 RepID=A0ABD2BK84_VESMC
MNVEEAEEAISMGKGRTRRQNDDAMRIKKEMRRRQQRFFAVHNEFSFAKTIHADANVSCKSNNSEQRNSAPDRPEGRPTSWEDQRVEFLWLQPVAG